MVFKIITLVYYICIFIFQLTSFTEKLKYLYELGSNQIVKDAAMISLKALGKYGKFYNILENFNLNSFFFS